MTDVAEVASAISQNVGLTPEQEELYQKLTAIKQATEAAKPRCSNCGSDLHTICSHSPGR